MAIAITSSLLFILVAAVMRFAYYKFPIDKLKATWISFIFAAIATTICTLLSGEQQSTLITGFATMLICYNILCYNPFNHMNK